jgi:branched-subunit amino acid ABC-type transport system permease component
VPAVKDFLPYVVVGLTAGSVYGLAGTGLVLTYKTSGIFNFAYGTIAALMAYAFYDLRELRGLPWPLALAICVLVLAPLAGLLFERMARRLSDAPVATKVVATVGLIVGLQGLIIIRYGGSIILTKPFLPTRRFRILDVTVGADQLIVMVAALAAMVGLTLFLRTRSGTRMRAVVERPDLLAMHGISPVRVRQRAWLIGTAFTALCGIQLSTTVGLDAGVLTLLVVQAFGAAAIGMFTSIPLTYAGGLVIGLLAAMSTKYVASISWLSGIPPSVPFIVLFVVLVVAPSRWLVDFTVEHKPLVREPRRLPPAARVIAGTLLAVLLLRLPYMVGTRLPVFSSMLAYVPIFLSLNLLMRTSGQVSLAQLAFAAVGAAASARLAVEAGLPWLAAVVLGALMAVPVGAVLAVPAIRRSGLYLALATFGFAILLERLVFFTGFMFGTGVGTLHAPRPSFARSDEAYFYVLLAFVIAAVAFVAGLHRSRLGRLLRAMADSPTALTTSGTSVTAIKVIIFCVAAFFAGLGGALLGPVTGNASSANFTSFAGLYLVVLAVVVGGSEVTSSIVAALALTVLPSYITSASLNNYLPVVFGLSAVLVSMSHAGMQAPAWLVRAATNTRRHPHRSRLTARLEARAQAEVL